MPVLQGTMYEYALLASLLFATTHGSSLDCCNAGIDWEGKSRNCQDGSKINLDCPMGMYMVDPNEYPDEYYYVEENSSTLMVAVNNHDVLYNVTPGNFCQTHLDNETRYLICFTEDAQESTRPLWRITFFGLCSMLSSGFLALTLLVYLVLPELRDLQDKAMMSVCASFMVAFFLTANQNLNFPGHLQDDVSCILIAFFMYYAYMCAFFWLNVISLNIWKSVWFPSLKMENNVLFAIYCVLGWGVPLCFLAFAIVTHNVDGIYTRPGFGEGTCWFHGEFASTSPSLVVTRPIQFLRRLFLPSFCSYRLLRYVVVLLRADTRIDLDEFSLPRTNRLETVAQVQAPRLLQNQGTEDQMRDVREARDNDGRHLDLRGDIVRFWRLQYTLLDSAGRTKRTARFLHFLIVRRLAKESAQAAGRTKALQYSLSKVMGCLQGPGAMRGERRGRIRTVANVVRRTTRASRLAVTSLTRPIL